MQRSSHLIGVGISSFQQCSHKVESLNSVLLYIMVYVGTGEKVRANRERDGMLQGARRYVSQFERSPAQIRAGALMSWSTRPDMLERSVETEFYSLEVSCFGK